MEYPVNYKPLPDFLTVKPSTIHGLGVFATQTIEEGATIGITHVTYKGAEDGYLRTPLGGFGNHSDEPNCFKFFLDNAWHLCTNRKIKVGEEITWKYSLYKPNEGT